LSTRFSEPRTIIGIIGGHSQNTSGEAMAFAEAVGAEIGRRGLTIACGGFDGVMEAACRGCRGAGGATLATLKGNDCRAANPYIDYAICTSMDVASNNIIIWSSAGIIAFDGRYGTLNEMALALDFGKPLITTGRQQLLNVAAVTSEDFEHYEGYDFSRIPAIVDRLLSMIERKSMNARQ
jgi:uncharacterized protein (TIGR00725 family)